MQISVLNGAYSSGNEFRTSYPVNYTPVPKTSGLSAGYLRPAEGLKRLVRIFAKSGVPYKRPGFPGLSTVGYIRGAVHWNGKSYFVCGDSFSVLNDDDTTTLIDNIKDDGKPVRFSFSFDRLAIASGGNLYYLTGESITQVTDVDIGTVNDVKFLDGYFATTDGTYILVTKLNDPTDINPLSYGSSEVDPDPIVALIVNRNELYAINRYTIEVFTNTGGALFPFTRINGAHIQRGAVGRDAVCVYNEALAFVGSARNEPPAVYLGENAQTIKLSTREIDQILAEYTPEELEAVFVETRTDKGHKFLYVHLPDRTLVYDSAATLAMQEPIWHILTTSRDGWGRYLARYFIWAGSRWLCGDPSTGWVGYLTDDVASHWDVPVRTEFSTLITWSETGGAVFHGLELQVISSQPTDHKIAISYTTDGKTWSQDRWAREFQRRVTWAMQGFMTGWRAYRFRGTSEAMLSVARLDAKMEPLIP